MAERAREIVRDREFEAAFGHEERMSALSLYIGLIKNHSKKTKVLPTIDSLCADFSTVHLEFVRSILKFLPFQSEIDSDEFCQSIQEYIETKDSLHHSYNGFLHFTSVRREIDERYERQHPLLVSPVISNIRKKSSLFGSNNDDSSLMLSYNGWTLAANAAHCLAATEHKQWIASSTHIQHLRNSVDNQINLIKMYLTSQNDDLQVYPNTNSIHCNSLKHSDNNSRHSNNNSSYSTHSKDQSKDHSKDHPVHKVVNTCTLSHGDRILQLVYLHRLLLKLIADIDRVVHITEG
jgi:hypothetical protein